MQNKLKNKNLIITLSLAVILAGLFYWGYSGRGNFSSVSSEVAKAESVTVYYEPTCGCCVNYLSYLRRYGFEVEAETVSSILSVKDEYDVPHEMMSCHTSVVGGYVVEGHIPVEIVAKLLKEKPEIRGIAIPGMPDGSPGMGGRKTEAWAVYELTENGVGGVFMEY